MKDEFVKATRKDDGVAVEINASVATGMALLSLIAATISALAVDKMGESK